MADDGEKWQPKNWSFFKKSNPNKLPPTIKSRYLAVSLTDFLRNSDDRLLISLVGLVCWYSTVCMFVPSEYTMYFNPDDGFIRASFFLV